MRRAPRQKTSGYEYDWTDQRARTRRIFRLNRRPGIGKYIKRALARKRRRQPIENDDADEEGEAALDGIDVAERMDTGSDFGNLAANTFRQVLLFGEVASGAGQLVGQFFDAVEPIEELLRLRQ